MQYSLNINTLKAAHFCSATKDVRYYLNSVYLDFKLGGAKPYVNVVSTDGHVLAAYKDTLDIYSVPDGDFNIMIPLDTVKTLLKMVGKKQKTVNLEKVGDSWRIGDLNFEAIDGKFPDYTRVIPGDNTRNHENGAPRLDPALVLLAQKSFCTRLGKPVNTPGVGSMAYGPSKNDSAILHGGDNTGLVVIMPLRDAGDTYFGFTA